MVLRFAGGGCSQVFRTVDPEALISLVVFTGVVSVYRLGRAGAAVADVLPGEETLPEQVRCCRHTA